MSLGKGYEYLLSSVVRGDGAVVASSPLTRYYAESGTPPGRLLGAGLAGLNDGKGVPDGTVVSEEMLFHLLGMLADPVTGRPLGRRPPHSPAPLVERVRRRVAELPGELTAGDRAVEVAAIEAEERDREARIARPVSGFDLTFSVPKSVSVVWALADPETQALIYRAHQDAVRIALDWAERTVLFSRTGAGGAVQEEIRGVIAAAFDHWDSRAGDPHLHTHVVIANRVQTLDGRWRTLDSRTLHRYVVALSELHEGVLHDLLTARLGYAWDERSRRHSAVPRFEIAGVPDALIEHFSQRSVSIEAATTALVDEFARAHGRHPSTAQLLRLRQQATLATRPDKQHRSLAEQTEQWRARARDLVGGDAVAWTDMLRGRCPLPPLSATDLGELLSDVARLALETVASKRATFSHGNVLAEVHRQLHGVRFASPDERLALAERMTRTALDGALQLTPRELEAVPAHLRRVDGSSKLRHRGSEVFTTREILDAETRLLDAGRNTAAPLVPAPIFDAVTSANARGRDGRLGADQVAAVAAIATSGRTLDVLVGAAGTGKTTSLAALREAWERTYGAGSARGLAPSAAAADALAAELGIDTDNTAKWLHEAGRQDQRLEQLRVLIDRYETETSSPSTVHAQNLRRQLAAVREEYLRWRIDHGQLIIIDEAGLAGTLALDQIVGQALDSGGKVLLVGDWAQLSALQAGGAFSMLVNDRSDAPELTTVRRFQQEWEREASTQLRAGNEAAVDAYIHHDRARSGDRAAMLDALYRAWREDTQRGLTSLMIAADHASVAELNHRARADRVATGQVSAAGIAIADGCVAGVGDQVVTRRNDRRLTLGPRSWVKNGDRWSVHAIHDDGTMTVHRQDGHGEITLPADYVHEHVELGYATTTFRTQGHTVDTAHALVSDGSTRESLYVAATRGRHANTLYVDTCTEIDEHTSHGTPPAANADHVLKTVLARSGSDTSAHTAMAAEQQLADILRKELVNNPPEQAVPAFLEPWTATPIISPSTDLSM